MLLVVRTCAVFEFFLFPCSHTIDLGWRGGIKVFGFDIVKIFLVAPLYFLTDCLKIMRKKVQISRALTFFQNQLEKSILLEVRLPAMQLP